MRWVVLIGLGLVIMVLGFDAVVTDERRAQDGAKGIVLIIVLVLFFTVLAVWFPSSE